MVAKYVSIYKHYLDKIRAGVYTAGDKFPTEKEIASEFGVSRDTTRKALALLQKDGVISRNQGSGSTVINHEFYNFSLTSNYSFKEWTKLAGFNGKTKLLEMEFMDADEKIKNYFNTHKDFRVCYIKRYRYIDGEKAFLDVNYILEECVEGITQEIVENSLYDYVENIKGYEISYVDRMIFAQLPTPEEKEEWGLNDSECFLTTEGQAFLKNGKIFNYTIVKHRNKYKFKEVSHRDKIL